MVGSARTEEGGDFVGVLEAWLVTVVELFYVKIEISNVLVELVLELLGEDNLVLGQLVGSNVSLSDLRAESVILRIDLVASIGLNPLLYLSIPVFNEADAIVERPILVLNLVMGEADLLGEILDAIDPILKNQPGIEGLALGHLLDEVDGQVVSRHFG